jgi:hypothetical protein
MPPKLNRKRALFVLTKIDEILAWEKQKEAERDTRFVELGRYSPLSTPHSAALNDFRRGERTTRCCSKLTRDRRDLSHSP